MFVAIASAVGIVATFQLIVHGVQRGDVSWANLGILLAATLCVVAGLV